MKKIFFFAFLFLSSACFAEDIFSDKGLGIGVRSGVNPDSPNLLFKIEYLVFRHEDVEIPVEPMYYWLRLNGDVGINTSSNSGSTIQDFNLNLALAGVRLHEWDDFLSGEAIRIEGSRNYQIDEKTVVRVTAFGGLARVMLPMWNEPGKHDLWIQAMLDVVGYKMASHLSELSTFHGFEVGRLGAELGMTIYPVEDFPIRLLAGGQASFAFNFSGTQSDLQAYVALRSDISKRFKINFQAGIVGAHDGHQNSQFTHARQLVGGILVLF